MGFGFGHGEIEEQEGKYGQQGKHEEPFFKSDVLDEVAAQEMAERGSCSQSSGHDSLHQIELACTFRDIGSNHHLHHAGKGTAQRVQDLYRNQVEGIVIERVQHPPDGQ